MEITHNEIPPGILTLADEMQFTIHDAPNGKFYLKWRGEILTKKLYKNQLIDFITNNSKTNLYKK